MRNDAITIKPTILGNSSQIESEKIVLKLMHDSEIVALQEDLKGELAKMPRGQSPSAADRIETVIQQWTAGLIIDEVNYLRRNAPDFSLGGDTAPRRWFGHTFPGNGKAGDNPDAIYRSTVVDGRGRYEVTGQFDPARRPAQILFSMFAGTLLHPVPVEQKPGESPNPDAGLFKNLGNISDHQLNVAEDGSFRILLGGEADGTANHLPTEPVPCSFGCRQILLDWTTPPLRLSIRRLDRDEVQQLDIEEVRQTVLSDLQKSVRFWASYPDVWLGGVTTNNFALPAPREGGWGFIGGVNFKLEPGECALVTMHPGEAAYMGIQLTDPWMLAPDHGRNQTCLNKSQSVPDADGRFTYVISPVDPGISNWIDSCGMAEGMALLRWQNFPNGATDNSGLFHDFRVISMSELDQMNGLARITPEQRSHQITARRECFFSRFTAR